MAPRKKDTTGGGTAVAERPKTLTTLLPEVEQEQLAAVGKSLDQQMQRDGSTAQLEQPTNGTLPLAGLGVTLLDVQGKIREIDGHITALEERISQFRQQREFHAQVATTYWPGS